MFSEVSVFCWFVNRKNKFKIKLKIFVLHISFYTFKDSFIRKYLILTTSERQFRSYANCPRNSIIPDLGCGWLHLLTPSKPKPRGRLGGVNFLAPGQKARWRVQGEGNIAINTDVWCYIQTCVYYSGDVTMMCNVRRLTLFMRR